MTSFSVIIPTRGRHHFLRQAIGSVLEQQHAAHEIIVVDDGEGAAEAVGRMHASVRVLDNRQRGPVPARDLGVSEATGDCIAFLDDDDWWTDAGYLKTAATRFEAWATFTFANGIMAFEDGRELGLQQAHHSSFWTWLVGFVFGSAITTLIAWSI